MEEIIKKIEEDATYSNRTKVWEAQNDKEKIQTLKDLINMMFDNNRLLADRIESLEHEIEDIRRNGSFQPRGF